MEIVQNCPCFAFCWSPDSLINPKTGTDLASGSAGRYGFGFGNPSPPSRELFDNFAEWQISGISYLRKCSLFGHDNKVLYAYGNVVCKNRDPRHK